MREVLQCLGAAKFFQFCQRNHIDEKKMKKTVQYIIDCGNKGAHPLYYQARLKPRFRKKKMKKNWKVSLPKRNEFTLYLNSVKNTKYGTIGADF